MGRIFNHADIPLSGQSVIEASAGTGKTYAIMQIYLRLLVEKKIPIDKILVVTFTDAATAELRARIRGAIVQCVRKCKGEAVSFIDDDRYFKSLFDPERPDASEIRAIVETSAASFDESAIFTIHGFCKRVLRDHAFEYSTIFNAELLGDVKELMRDVTVDFFRKKFYRASAFTLEWRKSRGIGIKSLSDLLGQTAPHADLRIVPENNAAVTPDICGKRLEKLFASFGKKWKKDYSSLAALMNEHIAALNGRSYTVGKTEVKAAAISSALGASDYFADLSSLDYFNAEKISSCQKKNQDVSPILSHPLIDEIGKFSKEYYAIHNDLGRAEAYLYSEYLAYAMNALVREKTERNLWSFDDLISQVRDGLVSEKGEMIASSLRLKYLAALIDEFQDTDPAQCDIFEKIFNHDQSLLFYIGDPKQAIYSFRGADVYAYIRAKEGKERYQKDENWRSNKPLVDGINSLFSGNDPFMLKGAVEYYSVRAAAGMTLSVEGDDDESVILWAMPTIEGKPYADGTVLKKLTDAVTGEISRLISKGAGGDAVISADGEVKHNLRPGDIAVIVRRNNDAYRMKERLRKAGIPSVIAQGGSVFESPVRWQFDILLNAIISGKEHHMRAALVTDLFACTSGDINAMLSDDSERERVLELFRTHAVLWESRGFMPMITSLFAARHIAETLASRSDGTRKVVDLLHLVELYHRAEMENGLGPSELLTWSRERAEEAPRSDEHQFRLETDDDAVKIITVHRSKGLEYPVVFSCVGWEPYESSGRPRYFYHDAEGAVCDLLHASDKGSDEYRRAGDELAAEHMRLLYVALTRASCRVYTLGGVSAGYHRSSMAYLLHNSRVSPEGGIDREKYEDAVKELSFEEIMSDMNSFASHGSVKVEILPDFTDDQTAYPESKILEALAPKMSKRVLRDDWKISSFSYIVSSRNTEHETEYDEDDFPRAVISDDGYPKGAAAGNCIHEIFENTDFASYNDEHSIRTIADRLKKYGIHSERNELWVRGMVASVLAKKIALMGTSLSETKPQEILREMEFYFPAKSISDREFRDLLTRITADPEFNGGKTRSLAAITFDRFAGFLRGFIDLVVEHNGRYYIADWKSNYLGIGTESYAQEYLCDAMDSHLYTVQALIYTLALDRHLSARLPDYDYEKHFGGVIYVFVRGVNPDGGEGLWEYRPSESAVKELRKGLIREDRDESNQRSE